MKHFTTSAFWSCFDKLPSQIQTRARKNFELLKSNPAHASLHYKKVQQYYSVRIGLQYRALGVEIPEGVVWFWNR